MLNRRHIRIKVLQSLYAYYISDKEFPVAFIKNELDKNIWRLYDLYLFLLLFIREFSAFIEKYDDDIKNAATFLSKININERLYNSSIYQSLSENVKFSDQLTKNKIIWDNEDKDILRKLFSEFKSTESYGDFIRKEEITKSDEFEIFVYFIKHYCTNSLLFTQYIEDKFINWHDDEKPAIQMVVKTLTTIISQPEQKEFLVLLSTDPDASIAFSKQLFQQVIDNDEELTELITARIDKWEPSRIPVIDSIVLKIGLAELLYFPTIPVKVTINECIELVKNYSLPSSKKFINAVLDNLLNDLEKEGKIQKKGIGLIDK